MGKVTLRDVAAASDVSVATVSMVMTGRYGNAHIAPTTIQRVREQIAALGYVPNAAARDLRARGTGQIGVMLRPLAPATDRTTLLALDGALFVGLSEAVSDKHLPAYVVYPLAVDEVPVPSRYLDGRIAGLLIRCAQHSEDVLLADLDPARLPIVLLWRQKVPNGVGFADIDHQGGARDAVRHLLTLGHRRIVFFGDDDGDNIHFPLRYRGYLDALEEAGIAPRPEWRATDSRDVLRLIRSPEPVTAAFAPADMFAAFLARDLEAVGVRIPEDFSLVGFDNAANAELIAGGLTTVDHPVSDMAIQGVRNLLALIQGAPVEECRTILPTRLVVRRSTARPPAAG